MKITLLASGSKGNSCLIEANDNKILIDCGTTRKYLLANLERIDVNLDQIDALLITHDHTDHTRQINTFKNHRVFSPTSLKIEHEYVYPYESFEFEGFEITPIQTSHDAELSVGYVIKNNGQTLVYITDTGYIRSSDYKYLENADYYVMESNHDPDMLMQTARPYSIKRRILSDTGHLSNDQAGEILSDLAGDLTKEIILAHISEQGNCPVLAKETVESHLNNAKIKVYAAKQFEIMFGGNYYEK